MSTTVYHISYSIQSGKIWTSETKIRIKCKTRDNKHALGFTIETMEA